MRFDTGPAELLPYTASMSLKTAAFFALIGMILVTIVVALGFLREVTAFLHDAVAATTFLASLIYLLGSLSLTVFFFVFHRAQ